MKPHYMEWLFSNEGISTVRKKYNKIMKRQPYCLALHKKMIELEDVSLTPSKRWILYAHTMACKQFGSRKIGELVYQLLPGLFIKLDMIQPPSQLHHPLNILVYPNKIPHLGVQRTLHWLSKFMFFSFILAYIYN